MILSTVGKYGVKEKFYLFKKTVETRNSDHNLILPLFLTAIFCSFKIMWDSEMECGEGVGGLLYYIRAYQVQLLMLSQVNQTWFKLSRLKCAWWVGHSFDSTALEA